MMEENHVEPTPCVPGAIVEDSSGVEISPGGDNESNSTQQTCNINCDNKCDIFEYVYRIDERNPTIIFKEGFQPKEEGNNDATICSHLFYKTYSFVSTTSIYPGYTVPYETKDAKQFDEISKLMEDLMKEGTFYVYKIKTNKTFYNAMGSIRSEIKKINIHPKNWKQLTNALNCLHIKKK